MKKWSEKYTEWMAILVSLMLLGISSLFSWDSNPIMGFDKLCADLIISLVCIGMIKGTGLWSTAGFQKQGFGKGLLYGSPFLVIGLGSIIVSNIGMDFSKLTFISAGNMLLFTINMLFVGVNEEIWMRSFVLNGLIRKYGDDKKGCWKAIIISALIFGAIHIPNIFFMNPITLCVQVINAASAGVLFGVIFIKSRNIWAGILVHALVDWCSLFIGNCFIGADTVLSMEMTMGQAVSIILLGSMPLVLIACFLMRKKDNEGIEKNEK